MTQLGSDDFNRTNQTGFGTSDIDSQVWSQVRGVMNWAITSHKGTCNSAASSTFNIFRLGTKTTADIDLVVRVIPSDTTSDIGVIARYVDNSNFYYGVLVGGNVVIGKDVSSTFSTLKSVAFSYSAGTAYWLRFRLVGTSLFLKAWADGSSSGEPNTWNATITDSSLTSGGFGLGSDSGSATNTQFDAFYVVDYANAENLTASDALLLTGAASSDYNPSDNLSIADALLLTGGAGSDYIPLESLTASDTLLLTGGASSDYIPFDSLSIADLGGLINWNIDALSAQENILSLDALNTQDIVSAAEALLAQDNMGLSDALNAAENMLQASNPSLLDSLAASDAAMLFLDLALPLESLLADDSASSMSQSGGGITNNSMASLDSLLASDILATLDSSLPLESLSINEAQNSNSSQQTIETLSLSENALAADLPLFFEGLVLAEQINLAGLISLPETLSGSSQVVVMGLDQPLESLLAADLLASYEAGNFIDASVITDMASLQSWLSDALQAGSLSLFASGAALAEIQPIQEALLRGDIVSLNDLLSVLDTFIGQTTAPQAPPAPNGSIMIISGRGSILIISGHGSTSIPSGRGNVQGGAR